MGRGGGVAQKSRASMCQLLERDCGSEQGYLNAAHLWASLDRLRLARLVRPCTRARSDISMYTALAPTAAARSPLQTRHVEMKFLASPRVHMRVEPPRQSFTSYISSHCSRIPHLQPPPLQQAALLALVK